MVENITPIRHQYLRIKRQYPQVILFFRLGDFYETFDEDARISAQELEIVLTSRSMGKGHEVPMAGIPFHAVESYLARLISRGHKVAICEQITRPGENKGIVQREVVRLVTPGTAVEPSLLDAKVNNYLLGLVPGDTAVGLAYVDITTGEFAATQTSFERATAELDRLKPSEVVAAKSLDLARFNSRALISRLEDYDFEIDYTNGLLTEHFQVATLEGFGLGGLPLAIRAAGGVLKYLNDTQKAFLPHLTTLKVYSPESFMALDLQTQNNLEIMLNSRDHKIDDSLLSVLDLTRTSMGGRLLKRFLGQPLLKLEQIEYRQSTVEWLFGENARRMAISAELNDVPDLERLINRVKAKIASPRELLALRRGLEVVPRLKEALETSPLEALKAGLKVQGEVVELISRSLNSQAPAGLNEGGVIQTGFSPELDELRQKSVSSKEFVAGLERKERERTGIKSLKVGYNRVFGYYIEVSSANLKQVPADYIRKQTLSGGERYFTPELKDYESQILHAQERILELESELYLLVCGQVAAYAEPILALAQVLAELDCYCSLAEVAVRNNYVRPEIDLSLSVEIKEGRHPVVERNLPEGAFIANDTLLSNDDNQLIILTGPNMSGKSTYLRQVALIVLMAQIGSFVPAGSARIGIVDRIFTRIGAGEDLAAGKSTFMVEMTETANILNNATPRSLIILDEIGRGTSTYDGLSIARAVVEYIHNSPGLGSKTLFATHYHELIDMAGFLPRVKNFNVAVTESGGEVIFLRKIVPGGVDKSYGIHVARLAGLPRAVVQRAQEVLFELEGKRESGAKRPTAKERKHPAQTVTQISFFGTKPALLEEIEKLDINALTPLEALTKLYELQQKAKQA
jgi:DNA mismatch repair protein MutS